MDGRSDRAGLPLSRIPALCGTCTSMCNVFLDTFSWSRKKQYLVRQGEKN